MTFPPATAPRSPAPLPGPVPWGYGPRRGRVKTLARTLRLFLFFLFVAVPSGSAWAEPWTILAYGDSLTAGFNLPSGTAFPAQLEEALRQKGYDVRLVNGGVSGDTTAGGLARLDWMLSDRPDIVVLELGANDALRGIPPQQVYENLAAIIERLQAEGVRILLTGMLAPPNMGAEYAEAFNAIYPRLAERYDIAFYPFFLDGVAAQPDLLQSDGMHPTPEGVAVIVRRILPKVEKLLNEVLAERKATR